MARKLRVEYPGAVYRAGHKLFGHLFSGRYKSLIVDDSENGYLKTVCDYAHLNPARARMLVPEGKLARYPWSSVRGYLTMGTAGHVVNLLAAGRKRKR
jgi:hypothetical protein